MTSIFATIDSRDLETITGGLTPAGAKAGAKAIGDLFGGGGPQVNTNVQTGQGNQVNQNTGSGNQTIHNGPVYNGCPAP